MMDALNRNEENPTRDNGVKQTGLWLDIMEVVHVVGVITNHVSVISSVEATRTGPPD